MATKKSKPKKVELRIRMYRVGFGDFFLMTVPTDDGPQHILIDCGVTKGKAKKGEHAKGDIGTIKAAVAHMANETGKKLALIIVTHRHEDHIIGFSRAAEIFNDFKVGAIWMSVWETEYDPHEKKEKKKKSLASEFQEQLTALAMGLQSRLAMAASGDDETDEILAMLRNATGIDHAELAATGSAGSAKKGTGGGSNAASLTFLKTGLGLEPEYYVKGDKPKLPKVLKDAGLTAQILGPPPLDAVDFMKLMDLRKTTGQYLGDAEDGNGQTFDPFGASWRAERNEYPAFAFREFERESKKSPGAALEATIQSAQPNLLFTAAKTLDNFLNNQSLVVLFTFAGKKLLFAGDAQGGNWEYWMYGGTPDTAPSVDQIDKDSASILSHLDFYKVGHHGSTNATPVSAVQTMGGDFASMCSTQEGAFGSETNESEVPRGPLLDALAKKSKIVRSDQFAITLSGSETPAIAGAPKKLPTPKRGRFEKGPIYIDYFP